MAASDSLAGTQSGCVRLLCEVASCLVFSHSPQHPDGRHVSPAHRLTAMAQVAAAEMGQMPAVVLRGKVMAISMAVGAKQMPWLRHFSENAATRRVESWRNGDCLARVLGSRL